MTELIAHRGRGAQGPENAVEALAGLAPWVAGVEIDARVSADGEVVLMHDAAVDRTTDGAGAVADLTAEALTALRVVGGGRVPTLAGYLDAVAATGLATVLVDVKHDDPATLAAVVAVVAASPVSRRCVVLVRSSRGLAELRRRAPALRLGGLGLTRENVTERVAGARAADAELLLVAHGDAAYLAHRDVLGQVRRAGLRVGASTINSDEAVGTALDDGCDVVLTDATHRWGPSLER